MMHAIGIDVSDQTFTATCVTPTFQKVFWGQTFAQTPEGWERLIALCRSADIAKASASVVMEATGVYSERISHYLYQQGFTVHVEPPGKIHNAFYERGKNDPVDSRQIAEYGFRFADQLHPWQPKTEILDQLQTLLTTREQLTGMITACKNAQHSLTRKHYQIHSALAVYGELAKDLQQRIDRLDQEIQTVLATNPLLQQMAQNVQSIPNLGFLLTVNLLVVTEGFTQHLNHAQLAAYIGICPFEYQSGTSIKRRPRSDGDAVRATARRSSRRAAQAARERHRDRGDPHRGRRARQGVPADR